MSALGAALCGPGPVAAQGQPLSNWDLISTIDLDARLGSPIATSIGYDPTTGELLVADTNKTFIRLDLLGQVTGAIDLSATAMPMLDNGGLTRHPTTGSFFYANGLKSTANESVFEFDSSSALLSSRSAAQLVEAVALTYDPRTRHLFVVDVGDRFSARTLREYSLGGGGLQLRSSVTLPSATIAFADAGLEFNPWTDNLALAGENASNDGRIYDLSRQGAVLGLFFDTGITQGIAGLAFAPERSLMFVLSRTGAKRILIYRLLWTRPRTTLAPVVPPIPIDR